MAIADYVLEWVTDYAPRYLNFLLGQWRQVRREGIVNALLSDLQELENAIQQVYRGCNLDTAEGVQLDRLGRLLLVPRDGLTDEVYRTRLRVEIAILTSNGTPEDLIAVVRAAVTPGVEFAYSESYPAGVVINVFDSIPEFLPPELFSFLNRARALGIRLMLIYSPEDAAHTFTFSSGLTLEIDSDRGFGDSTDAAIGGVLAGVYS